MRILTPEAQTAISSGAPLRLNLGSGGGKGELPGYLGVDLLALPGVAIQADLNEPLDLIPDSSVEAIHSSHCFEHVDNFMGLMREVHRVLKPGGLIHIATPHFSNPFHYSDPTHVRFFGLYTMYYFVDPAHQPTHLRTVPCFYTDTRFQVERIRLRLMPRSTIDRLLTPKLESLVNRSIEWQDRYERRLCRLFPAYEIEYDLVPLK